MLTFGAEDHEQAEQWMRAQDMAVAADHARDPKFRDTRSVLPPVISDAAGFNLCPDPLSAATAAEFMEALRLFRVWAGEPSFREMARACGNAVGISTMCTVLNGSELPTLRIMLAIVSACGASDEHQRAFATAWRKVRMAQVQKPSQEEHAPAGSRRT